MRKFWCVLAFLVVVPSYVRAQGCYSSQAQSYSSYEAQPQAYSAGSSCYSSQSQTYSAPAVQSYATPTSYAAGSCPSGMCGVTFAPQARYSNPVALYSTAPRGPVMSYRAAPRPVITSAPRPVNTYSSQIASNAIHFPPRPGDWQANPVGTTQQVRTIPPPAPLYRAPPTQRRVRTIYVNQSPVLRSSSLRTSRCPGGICR